MDQHNGDLWSAHFFFYHQAMWFLSLLIENHSVQFKNAYIHRVNFLSFSAPNWLGNLKVVWGIVHQNKRSWQSKWLTAVGQYSVTFPVYSKSIQIEPSFLTSCCIHFYPRSTFALGLATYQFQWLDLPLLNCVLLGHWQ